MDFVTRQFIVLAKKLRKELRDGLRNISQELHEQSGRSQKQKNTELTHAHHTPIVHELHVLDDTIDRIKAESPEEKRRKQRHDRVAIATLGIALAYTIFAGYQWLELNTQNINQSAANISQSAGSALSLAYARKQIRTDQRAWVVFDTKYLDDKLIEQVGKPIIVPIQITNLGKTPARHISGIVVVDELGETEVPDFNYLPGRLKGHIEAGILYPTYSQSSEVTPGQTRHRGKVLKIHGRISYIDSFQVQHWITFCHEVGPSKVKTPQCVAQNSADNNDE